MKKRTTIITTILILLTIVSYGQENKVIKGIAIDGHRNPILAINVMVKGTTTGTVTDRCGEFSIPIKQKSVTLVFHGMSYDDMRAYEINLKQKDIKDDLLLFQLGNWKVKNEACKKKIDRKLKRYIIK
ncbi:MAG: carboxypeptidase-like regulatory domain-containing protein [Chryseolinea sp.]